MILNSTCYKTKFLKTTWFKTQIYWKQKESSVVFSPSSPIIFLFLLFSANRNFPNYCGMFFDNSIRQTVITKIDSLSFLLVSSGVVR